MIPLKLEDLLPFDDILIQCHNNPDADTIASGFALWEYLTAQGKSPRLVYGGSQSIAKPNLKRMCRLCGIPLQHVPDPAAVPEAELLVTVDCQPGENNTAPLRGARTAVIDHHAVLNKVSSSLTEIRSSCGACSTILWDMLRDAGYGDRLSPALATALYFGLYMDTTYFKRLKYPLDQDMVSALVFDPAILDQLKACNFSQEEIVLFGRALSQCRFSQEYGFAVVEAPPCDPNLLGAVSDQMMEVQSVDVCLSYFIRPEGGVRVSVRSYDPEILAYKLVWEVFRGLGSGGGVEDKAAGTLGVGVSPEGVPYGAALEEACREFSGDGPGGAVGELLYTRVTQCLRRGRASGSHLPEERTVDRLLQGTTLEGLTRAAEAGDPEAQHKLGVCYAYGRGVPRDWTRAAGWYRAAAEQGHAAAQKDLGVCCARGRGVPKDWGQAVVWYRRAAENGDARAQHNLAQRYYRGEGVGQSFQQAADWFRKAAEQGYAWSQYKLAACYAAGDGVRQDWRQAAHWYARAVEHGIQEAVEPLAQCYERGLGVGRDPEKAASLRQNR